MVKILEKIVKGIKENNEIASTAVISLYMACLFFYPGNKIQDTFDHRKDVLMRQFYEQQQNQGRYNIMPPSIHETVYDNLKVNDPESYRKEDCMEDIFNDTEQYEPLTT
jgi:hypothetical protein